MTSFGFISLTYFIATHNLFELKEIIKMENIKIIYILSNKRFQFTIISKRCY
jgi:hypothetical protein